MSFRDFILDTLTGSPAKGFSRSQLAEERRAQIIGIWGGILGAIVVIGGTYGFFHFLGWLAKH